LIKLGVDVTIFATKQTQTHAKVEYITDTPLSEIDAQLHGDITQKHIKHALEQSKNYDIIHNHFNIHPVLLAHTTSTPMITTLHGSASEKDNAGYYEQCKNENFVSISYAERSFMPRLNYLANVYNGVDFTKYTVKRNVGKYFVFSGRIVKEKGILSAINLSQQTTIPLKIAGIITDQEFFDTKVKPHIDDNLITFVGNLPYIQLVLLLQDALATVCLVEWDEPFGLSALDSLACGVPIIATRRGALPELIYDDTMGIIVEDMNEAIERLDEIYEVNSDACAHLAREKFSSEAMAEGYLECYLKLIKQSKIL
jgi:glycosyltransferase involved in cell wall biosynthesis